MSKTLLVTNDFPPRRGGIESFVFSLCAGMPSDELVVYTARMAGSESLDDSVDYPVIRDPARTLLPTPRVARAVQGVASEHGCARVIFGAAAPLGLLARGLRRNTPVSWVQALTHGHEVWWAKMPVTRSLLHRIGDEVDVLTYVSEFCRREIACALSPEAAGLMQRLSPTVDHERFHPGLDGSPWRRRLGLSADQPVVLSASRLVRRKGQDMLLKAWPQVLAQTPDARLVIVGDGPSGARLRRLARRLRVTDTVAFVPGVPWGKMPAVYAMADVFVLPCRTRLWGLEPEAFGIVYLEAAACGLPVLVGDSGGAPETVGEGVLGVVVPGREVGRIAEETARLLRLAGRARP